MPRTPRWSQLTVGLVTIGAVAVAAIAVIRYARVGAIHGSTTTIYMVTDRASRVIKGTEVWLGGQKVGAVEDVTLRPVSTDTTDRVLIRMKIRTPFMRYVRRNSDVQIRPGTSLIGAPVVYITIGTRRAPPVRAGDTLRGRSQFEQRPATADIGSLADSVQAVLREASQITPHLDTTASVVLALRRRAALEATHVSGAIRTLRHRSRGSGGTVARALDDGELRARVARVAAVADSLRAAVAGRHGVARFVRDTTLATRIHRALVTTDSLRERLRRYAGVPVYGDSTLAHTLERTHRLLDSLATDLKRHPLRYVPF